MGGFTRVIVDLYASRAVVPTIFTLPKAKEFNTYTQAKNSKALQDITSADNGIIKLNGEEESGNMREEPYRPL